MWWQQWGGSVQRELLMCSREEQLWLKVSPSHRGRNTSLGFLQGADSIRRCALFTSVRGLPNYLKLDLGSVLVVSVEQVIHWYEVHRQYGVTMILVQYVQISKGYITKEQIVWYCRLLCLSLLTNMFLLWFCLKIAKCGIKAWAKVSSFKLCGVARLVLSPKATFPLHEPSNLTIIHNPRGKKDSFIDKIIVFWKLCPGDLRWICF